MHVGYEAAFQHRDSYPDELFVREELEYCVRAEAFGFDSVWLTEHHFSNYGLIPDPLQALAYIAGRTTRIKLGTAVIVLPWHDPVRVTEQVILADHLSNGRSIIGLGRGLGKAEFDGLRISLDDSRALFSEYADLLLRALETGIIEGGELTRQPRRELRPRPFKSFEGRIFGALVSPTSAPLLAGLGIAPMFILIKPPDLLQADLMKFRSAWSDIHGPSSKPPQSILSAVVVVDESADRALELAGKYNQISHRIAVDHYGMADPEFGTAKGYEYYRMMRAAPSSEKERPPSADRPPPTVICGKPDQVLERFDEFRRLLNLQGILVIFHGIPHEDGERNVKCFVKHCMPELKSWQAAVTF